MTTSRSFSFDSLGTPGHLRRSANGPALISWHNFQRLQWLVSSVEAVLFSNVHSKFTASARGCSEETLFISFSKGVTGILRDRTCLEKDTKECSCLICDSSCCRTSCVSVQPCTPKVLPNTETFLHSRVFFVACVVPATLESFSKSRYRPNSRYFHRNFKNSVKSIAFLRYPGPNSVGRNAIFWIHAIVLPVDSDVFLPVYRPPALMIELLLVFGGFERKKQARSLPEYDGFYRRSVFLRTSTFIRALWWNGPKHIPIWRPPTSTHRLRVQSV